MKQRVERLEQEKEEIRIELQFINAQIDNQKAAYDQMTSQLMTKGQSPHRPAQIAEIAPSRNERETHQKFAPIKQQEQQKIHTSIKIRSDNSQNRNFVSHMQNILTWNPGSAEDDFSYKYLKPKQNMQYQVDK